MEESKELKAAQGSRGSQLTMFFGAIGVLVALICYSYTYDYPSGNPPDLWSFAAFWLRELLILFVAVLMFVIAGASCLLRLVRMGSKKSP